MKLYQVWGLVQHLAEIEKLEVSGRPAFVIAVNLSKIKPVIAAIDKTRLGLIKKYDVSGESVPNDKMEDFINEFNEFLKDDADIELKKFKVDDFEIVEGFKTKVGTINAVLELMGE